MWVELDDELTTLNRAVGVVRRRNVPIESIAVGPGRMTGASRLILMMNTDEGTADRVVQQLHKMAGVRDAMRLRAEDGVARELALVKVRAAPALEAELLDVLALYRARIVDEGADAVIVEASGSAPLIFSLVRALEPFGILDVARSGAIALPAAGAPPPSPSMDGSP